MDLAQPRPGQVGQSSGQVGGLIAAALTGILAGRGTWGRR
jgi:hypothetical protein